MDMCKLLHELADKIKDATVTDVDLSEEGIKFKFDNWKEVKIHGNAVELLNFDEERKSELYLSSSRKNEYPIYLTKEELESIPIILNMALVYSWDLYNKKEEDKFYKAHKENIDLIKAYHDKGYQGVLATGSFIESKAKNELRNIELNEILKQYMNNFKIRDEIIYHSKDIEIKNHIGEFNDKYIDFLTIIYEENKTYDVIPIDNKFTIPYVDNGTVKVVYKKLVKNCKVYEIKAEDYEQD